MARPTVYEEWKDFLQKPGAIAVMPFQALTEPCPKCGKHEGYGVTSDYWAYCNACGWGTSTEFAFTNVPYQVLNKDGKPQQKTAPQGNNESMS